MVEAIILIYNVIRFCIEGQQFKITHLEIDVVVRFQAIVSSHLVEFLLSRKFSCFDFITTGDAEGMLWGVDRIATEDACVLDFHKYILAGFNGLVKLFSERFVSFCERIMGRHELPHSTTKDLYIVDLTPTVSTPSSMMPDCEHGRNKTTKANGFYDFLFDLHFSFFDS